MIFLLYYYIYMIIDFLIEACFLGYIGALLIFLGPYYILIIYNIYILGLGIYSMC